MYYTLIIKEAKVRYYFLIFKKYYIAFEAIFGASSVSN